MSGKLDKALYDLFHSMFGEHLLVLNENCDYNSGQFIDVSDRNTLYYFGGKEQVDNLITDYMGNFLFPKKLLTSYAPTFLGFLVEKNKIEVDFSKFEMVDISKSEMPAPDETPASGVDNRRPSIPVMVVRKFRSDGMKGVARAVRSKVRK